MSRRLSELTESQRRDLCNLAAFSVRLACEYAGCEKPCFALVVFNRPQSAQLITNDCEPDEVIMAIEKCLERYKTENGTGIPWKPPC